MKIENVKIGMRLGASFGLVLMLTVMLIVVGLARLTSLGEMNDIIIHKDWVKADAAQTVDVMTRANARWVMELFLTSDKSEVALIKHNIEANRTGRPSTRRSERSTGWLSVLKPKRCWHRSSNPVRSTWRH